MAKVGDASNIPKENDKMVEGNEIDAKLESISPEMSDQDKIDHLEKISDYIAYGKSLMSIASILPIISRYLHKSQKYKKPTSKWYNFAIGIMVVIVIIFINIIAQSFGSPDIAEHITNSQKNKTNL